MAQIVEYPVLLTSTTDCVTGDSEVIAYLHLSWIGPGKRDYQNVALGATFRVRGPWRLRHVHQRHCRGMVKWPQNGDPAMANERCTVMGVECPRCKTKQKIHVAIPNRTYRDLRQGRQKSRDFHSVTSILTLFETSAPRSRDHSSK